MNDESWIAIAPKSYTRAIGNDNDESVNGFFLKLVLTANDKYLDYASNYIFSLMQNGLKRPW